MSKKNTMWSGIFLNTDWDKLKTSTINHNVTTKKIARPNRLPKKEENGLINNQFKSGLGKWKRITNNTRDKKKKYE